MTNFVLKNKAAQLQQRDGSELSTRDLQKMVQALPQYNEQMEKLSLHVEIAGKINKIIRDVGLRELGQLEQDLVFGDAGTKEVISFLRTKQDGMCENKLRLMMIYASVYPEKFEGDIAVKLMQELIEKLSKGELPEDEYRCMNNPNPSSRGNCRTSGASQTESVRTVQSTAPHSMRSRRTAMWPRPRSSDDGYSSDSVLRNVSNDYKKMGRRIFVFIIGGATRSELRVCHKLTSKLRREVVLGTTSIEDPPITKLKLLSEKGSLN